MSLRVTVGYEPDGSPSLRDRKLHLQVGFTRCGYSLASSQMIICGRSLHKIGGGICISADYFNCLMFLCFFFFFSCVGMRMLLYTTLFWTKKKERGWLIPFFLHIMAHKLTAHLRVLYFYSCYQGRLARNHQCNCSQANSIAQFKLLISVHKSLVCYNCDQHTHFQFTQVSRLQTTSDLCREVYEQVKGELKEPLEEYALFWPEQKVQLSSNPHLQFYTSQSLPPLLCAVAMAATEKADWSFSFEEWDDSRVQTQEEVSQN